MSDLFEDEKIIQLVREYEDRSAELYKILRGYIFREDNLINYRLGWLPASQGLLFSAYAFSLDKAVDVSRLHIVIFLIGIAVSLFSTILVYQARAAIGILYEIWREQGKSVWKRSLPQLIGGRNPGPDNGCCASITRLFNWTVVLIPVVFLIAWVGLWLYVEPSILVDCSPSFQLLILESDRLS